MVLHLLLIGLAIALDPLPLSAFVVILPSGSGVREGAAFLFGWLVSLAVVVTVTLLATGDNPPTQNTVPSLASLAVKRRTHAVFPWRSLRCWRGIRQARILFSSCVPAEASTTWSFWSRCSGLSPPARFSLQLRCAPVVPGDDAPDAENQVSQGSSLWQCRQREDTCDHRRFETAVP